MKRRAALRATAVVVPLTLVALFVATNVSATVAQRSLRGRWDAHPTIPAGALVLRTFAPGEPVARIMIPAISLDLVVVQGGNGHRGPAHIPRTVIPGTPGTSVVQGGTFGYGNFFSGLTRLRTGDEILVENMAGVVRLEVDRIGTLLDETNTDTPVLELIAPARVWGSGRLVVHAEPPARENR